MSSHDHTSHEHAGGQSHGAGGTHAHEHSGHSHGHAGHSHTHGVTDQRRIAWAFAIIAIFMVVEVVGGVVSGSLALLADAGHMISDAAALGFSWLAILYGRRPPTRGLSYGYRRLEILVAFVNGLALFVIAAWIVVEAIQRFSEPVPVVGKTMLIVAVVGLLANVAAFLVLNGGNRDNLNMRGAWLHVLGDLLGSAAAIVAAVVILLTRWTPIDPLLSIFVALIVLRSAWQVVRSAAHVLLEGAPAGIELAAVKEDVEANVASVQEAHHVHVWSMTGEEHLVTLHVRPVAGFEPGEVIAAVNARLRERFDIRHVTVQVESLACSDPVHGEGVSGDGTEGNHAH